METQVGFNVAIAEMAVEEGSSSFATNRRVISVSLKSRKQRKHDGVRILTGRTIVEKSRVLANAEFTCDNSSK